MKKTVSWVNGLVRLLLIITICAAIVPISPAMPRMGLDGSWVYGLGEAVGRGLVFGQDIVFTLGPYASVYTWCYHPATYHFVLFGSVCLALGFSILLTSLLARRSLLLSLLAIFFLACNRGAPDATLLLYPLLLALFVYRLTLWRDDLKLPRQGDSALVYLAVCVIFAVLGLIPLIKGSLLILAVTIGALSAATLYMTGRIRLAITALASSIVGLLLFWVITGQPLIGLFSYFANMSPIASGYTEAMSSKGKSTQVTLYLLPCLVSAIIILAAKSLPWCNRVYLLVAFGLFAFLGFKAGFVRHDAHATIAGSALFLAGLSLCVAYPHRISWISAALCIVSWFFINNSYYPITPTTAATQAKNEYERLGNGLWKSIRGDRSLPEDFEKTRAQLRQQHPILSMKGTSDIYPFDQSYLLASDNGWSPRPVFQSYSAYTPKLAELNRLHLIGPSAPDNVIFSVQPIDMRLPALDDGPSWPILMGLYRPVSFQFGYVYLQRRERDAQVPTVKPTLEQDYSIGETVILPESHSPLFAHIQMKRTIIGRLQSILFKPEELRIKLTLMDGTSRDYRFIPGMGEAGFVLSPLVESSTDFLMAYGSWNFLEDKRVVSFRISTKSRHPWSWSGYKLSLGELNDLAPTDISSLIAVVKPVKIAASGQPLSSADCFGSIDYLNGSPLASHVTSYSPVLSFQGWIAETRTVAGDDSFVATLTTQDGATYVAPLKRLQRADVAAYFKSDALRDSGFQVAMDVGELKGDVTVGLARKKADQWVQCTQYRQSVTLKTTVTSAR